MNYTFTTTNNTAPITSFFSYYINWFSILLWCIVGAIFIVFFLSICCWCRAYKLRKRNRKIIISSITKQIFDPPQSKTHKRAGTPIQPFSLDVADPEIVEFDSTKRILDPDRQSDEEQQKDSEIVSDEENKADQI